LFPTTHLVVGGTTPLYVVGDTTVGGGTVDPPTTINTEERRALLLQLRTLNDNIRVMNAQTAVAIAQHAAAAGLPPPTEPKYLAHERRFSEHHAAAVLTPGRG